MIYQALLPVSYWLTQQVLLLFVDNAVHFLQFFHTISGLAFVVLSYVLVRKLWRAMKQLFAYTISGLGIAYKEFERELPFHKEVVIERTEDDTYTFGNLKECQIKTITCATSNGELIEVMGICYSGLDEEVIGFINTIRDDDYRDEQAVPGSMRHPFKNAHPSVVILLRENLDTSGYVLLGHGVRIGDDIVTASHVVGVATHVANPTQVTRIIEINSDDFVPFANLDLAVLTLPDKVWSKLAVKSITKIGYLNSGPIMLRSSEEERGIRSTGIYGKPIDLATLQHSHSASSIPGDSGAPIFQHGALVAIHLGTAKNVNRMVSLAALKRVLNRDKVGQYINETPDNSKADRDEYIQDLANEFIETRERRKTFQSQEHYEKWVPKSGADWSEMEDTESEYDDEADFDGFRAPVKMPEDFHLGKKPENLVHEQSNVHLALPQKLDVDMSTTSKIQVEPVAHIPATSTKPFSLDQTKVQDQRVTPSVTKRRRRSRRSKKKGISGSSSNGHHSTERPLPAPLRPNSPDVIQVKPSSQAKHHVVPFLDASQNSILQQMLVEDKRFWTPSRN